MNCDAVSISIAIAGIIIGAILSFYFYRKSLRIKEPCWRITSNNINVDFNKKVDGLNITYKNKKVKTLTISKILFWNNGKETIYKQDMQTLNKFRIEAKEGIKLLDRKILFEKEPSNQIEVTIDENENNALIEFEYLDNNHGAVIQIIHTGTSSKDVDIVGTIIGVKNIRNRTTSPKWFDWIDAASNSTIMQKIKSRKSIGILSLISSAFFLLLSLVTILLLKSAGASTPTADPSLSSGSLITSIVVYFLSSLILFYMGLLALAPAKPKGYDIYFED